MDGWMDGLSGWVLSKIYKLWGQVLVVEEGTKSNEYGKNSSKKIWRSTKYHLQEMIIAIKMDTFYEQLMNYK